MYKAQIYAAHKQIYSIFVVLTFSLGVKVAIRKKWSKKIRPFLRMVIMEKS